MIPRAYEERVCGYCGYRDVSVYPNHGDPICAECWKRKHGKATSEYHHPFGRSIPETVYIPANLHAYFTKVKTAWPKDLHTYPIQPLLQIAYHLRNKNDLDNWLVNHPEVFVAPQRDQLIPAIRTYALNFESDSDYLISLHDALVKVLGKDYVNDMTLAPLLTYHPHQAR
jgi:hypothetical protein